MILTFTMILFVMTSCASESLLKKESDGSLVKLGWIYLKNQLGTDDYMWGDLQRWQNWRIKNKAIGNDLDKKYTREWFSGRIFRKGECRKYKRGYIIETRWCLAELDKGAW